MTETIYPLLKQSQLPLLIVHSCRAPLTSLVSNLRQRDQMILTSLYSKLLKDLYDKDLFRQVRPRPRNRPQLPKQLQKVSMLQFMAVMLASRSWIRHEAEEEMPTFYRIIDRIYLNALSKSGCRRLRKTHLKFKPARFLL